MRVLSKQEAIDILVGCTILGTGGGGDLQLGLDAIDLCYQQGKPVKLLGFDEINDQGNYVTAGLTGAISADALLPVEQELSMLADAVKALEEHMGVNFDGLVSTEYGGGNTGEGMAAAALLDKYYVDCDAAGRAVPLLQHSTYYITDQPMCPVSITTQYGDANIITKAQSDERIELMARALAAASGNLVALADHPITGKNLKTSVIPSALSYAEELGKAQRLALENSTDPVQDIITAGQGYLLFRGVVGEGTDWQTKDGFTFGSVCTQGIDEFNRQHFKLWYQNEHMMSWKNGEIFVTCPDLMCVVDNKTGHPITNPNCKEGDEIAILGFKANAFWRTDKGFAILNPRFFNFDVEHQPIETLC